MLESILRSIATVLCLLLSLPTLATTISDFAGKYKVVSSSCEDHAGNRYSNEAYEIDFEVGKNGDSVTFTQILPTLIKQQSWETADYGNGTFSKYASSADYELTYTEHYGPQSQIKWYNRFFGFKRVAGRLFFYQEYTQDPDFSSLYYCLSEIEHI